MEPIRLLLLDDHVLFRESLSRLLASEPDFVMAGHCGTAAEALDILAQTPVDVVLLDYDLGEDHGGQFIEAARRAGYTRQDPDGHRRHERRRNLHRAASWAPPGFFSSTILPAAWPRPSAWWPAGDMWVDPKVIHSLADRVREREEQEPAPAAHRTRTGGVQGLFEGLTNKEIAAQLGVSESAVKATLQQLFQKTHVRTRSQLVRIALESSLGTTRR